MCAQPAAADRPGTGADTNDSKRLIAQYLPLAYWWARRYHRPGIDVEDLRQVAAEALVRAAGNYDPHRGTAFAAYAGASIDGALKRYLRDYSWPIRPPRSLGEHALKVAAATDELTKRLHRSPTPAEVATEVGITVEQALQARDCLASRSSIASLDQLPGGADSARPAGTGELDPAIEQSENLLALAPLLAALPERDRRLLVLRFGHELTQTQIAEQFGISQMQVSRLLSTLLTRLRRRLLANPGPPGHTG